MMHRKRRSFVHDLAHQTVTMLFPVACIGVIAGVAWLVGGALAAEQAAKSSTALALAIFFVAGG